MTVTWNHVGNGQWKTSADWGGGTVPGAGDSVILPNETAAYSVTIGSAVNASVLSLEVDGDAQLNVAGTLAATNSITVDGGTLNLTGALSAGGIILNAGTLSGGGSIGSTPISGNGTVSATGIDGNNATASGGTLEFTKAVDATTSGTFNIASGATLAFDNAVGTSGGVNPSVSFLASGALGDGTLDLSGEGRGGGTGAEIAQFNATVSGFGYGDEIIVKGPTSGGGDTVSYSGGVLTVKHGNTVEETIKLAGSYTGQTFSVSYDAATKDDTITVCFMAGTLIRTPDGEVAVETIKRGDLVLAADGRVVPVTWIGRQTVSTRFADPLRVLPIRIRAGALGENVPARDLLLSPDHAILIDGALIHAGALVNGTSIVRETAVPDVFTYYHVEADDHSLILAEGVPAETFVDNVDRLNFDNWAEHQALYPQGKEVDELPYPRAKSHRQVPVHIRARLAGRALAIGAAPQAAAVA